MFKLCEARPDLSGALFLLLRLYNSTTDCFTSFAMTEKSGNGGRIKAPKLLQIKKPDSGESGLKLTFR